jgi:hypothetical protein
MLAGGRRRVLKVFLPTRSLFAALAVVCTHAVFLACTPIPFTGGDSGSGGGTGFGGGTSSLGGGGFGFGGGTATGDAGLALGSACGTLNERRCDFYARCALIDPGDSARRDCLAYMQATWCGPAKWPARVAVGTLSYDPLSAQSCADAFLTRACEDFDSLPPPCGDVTAPNVALQQACYDGYDECTTGVCRGAACPRTCQLTGHMGDVCQFDTDCNATDVPALFCRLSVVATGAGTCEPLGMANDLCSAEEPCSAGLLCVSTRCLMPPTLGAPCPKGVCDDTSWCDATADGGSCSARSPAGSQCTDDVHCQTNLICQGGQCVSIKVLTTGSTCSDRQTCPTGTVCVGATANLLGTCEPPLEKDQACISSDDCQAQLACAPYDGGLATGCEERLTNGAACTLDRDCEIYSRCLTGQCVRLPITGQDCSNAKECLFGPCVASDAGMLCVDTYGPGAHCTHDDDCASDRCLSGMCLPTCAP